MPASSADSRLPVRIEPDVWHEEVERYAPRSAARIAAERERAGLAQRGVDRRDLLRCAEEGTDATRLAGLVKAYVPIRDAPPSMRPYGLVFAPLRTATGIVLEMVSYGERHPRRPTRSVYERAHKRLHGRYHDQ